MRNLSSAVGIALLTTTLYCITTAALGGDTDDHQDLSVPLNPGSPLAPLGKPFESRPECYPCSSGRECGSSRCERGKCVYGNAKSRWKCANDNTVRRKECSVCMRDSQCVTARCTRNKCVRGGHQHPRSLQRCFSERRAECSKCRANSDCASKFCVARRCIQRGVRAALSVRKCFGPRRSECSKCSFGAQCVSGTCKGERCVQGGRFIKASIVKCFRLPKLGECSQCKRHAQCITDMCFHGRCLYGGKGTAESRKRCFPSTHSHSGNGGNGSNDNNKLVKGAKPLGINGHRQPTMPKRSEKRNRKGKFVKVPRRPAGSPTRNRRGTHIGYRMGEPKRREFGKPSRRIAHGKQAVPQRRSFRSRRWHDHLKGKPRFPGRRGRWRPRQWRKAAKLPECAPCIRNGNCVTGYCLKNKCIYGGRWKAASKRRCRIGGHRNGEDQ